MVGTIRVVLAEDHALMRDAVRLVFDEAEDVELVGEVANGNELLPLLKRVEADFVLLDVQLPGLDGLGCLEALAEHHPQREGRDALRGRGRAGDRVRVPARRRRLHLQVRQPVRPAGGDPPDRRRERDPPVRRGERGAAAPEAAGLSEKEVAVLVELCHGHTNKQIAAKLWLSEQTVKFHLRNVYRKLGIKSRTEALRYAYEHDLVALQAPAA